MARLLLRLIGLTLLVVGGVILGVFLFGWPEPTIAPTVPPLAPTATPTPAPTLGITAPDFTSGTSRFSQGSCQQDSDCIVSGCSGEVCGSEEAVTTCEYSDDFPSVRTHTCGCVAGTCGWQ